MHGAETAPAGRSPAAQGGLHPDGLGQEGQRAPLHKRAAHGDGDVLRAQQLCLSQLPRVAVVERVVFGDDTGKFHGVTSKVCEISVILHGETGLKNGILGRMYKKPGDFVAGFAAIAA